MVVRRGGAQCTCGRRGCLEAYAGRGSMELHARKLHDEGRETQLFKIMVRRGKTRLASGVWAEALEQGDGLAHELIERALLALGAGVASAVNLLDVEAIVIGGGLGSRLGQPYADRILEAMLPHLFVDERPPVVLTASLGDLGGAIGATLIAPVRARSDAESGTDGLAARAPGDGTVDPWGDPAGRGPRAGGGTLGARGAGGVRGKLALAVRRRRRRRAGRGRGLRCRRDPPRNLHEAGQARRAASDTCSQCWDSPPRQQLRSSRSRQRWDSRSRCSSASSSS